MIMRWRFTVLAFAAALATATGVAQQVPTETSGSDGGVTPAPTASISFPPSRNLPPMRLPTSTPHARRATENPEIATPHRDDH